MRAALGRYLCYTRADIEPLCGISFAPLAQISIYILSPHQFSLVLYARISIAVYGKYHAVRHITCAVGANIDLHNYPLIHRRRDDGPPAPRRSRPLFVTPKACHLSRYRESLPHKDCFAIGGRLIWRASTAPRHKCSKNSAKPSGRRSVCGTARRCDDFVLHEVFSKIGGRLRLKNAIPKEF